MGKTVRGHESQRIIIGAEGVVRVHSGHSLPQT
jgi:hypothetical protein